MNIVQKEKDFQISLQYPKRASRTLYGSGEMDPEIGDMAEVEKIFDAKKITAFLDKKLVGTGS